MATNIKLNSTVEAECKRIAVVLKAKGLNWTAEASAAVIVRAILLESGEKEMAESMEPADKEHRFAMVKAVLPFMTASINVQRTTLAPLGIMPEVKAAGQVVADELV